VERPGVRFNEGGADPRRQLLVRLHGLRRARGRRRAVPARADLSVEKVLDGVTISNGLGFSPDGTHAYYVDTPTRRVDVLDHRDGTLTGRRTAFEPADGPGSPDGLTVDAQGCVWVALFDGAAVHRYAPDGELLAAVPLPVAQVTACTFGGPELDRLYVTTSREGLDADTLTAQPLAGALFCVDLPASRPAVLESPAEPTRLAERSERGVRCIYCTTAAFAPSLRTFPAPVARTTLRSSLYDGRTKEPPWRRRPPGTTGSASGSGRSGGRPATLRRGDPAGASTRRDRAPLAGLGAYGVTFHDDDLIPFGTGAASATG